MVITIARLVQHPVVEQYNIQGGEAGSHFHRTYGCDTLRLAKTDSCIDKVTKIRIVIGVARQPEGWRSHVVEKNEGVRELCVFDLQLLRIRI